MYGFVPQQESKTQVAVVVKSAHCCSIAGAKGGLRWFSKLPRHTLGKRRRAFCFNVGLCQESND